MRSSLSAILSTVLVSMALIANLAHAQQASGRITGTVTDSSNAVLPGARVEIKQQGPSVASIVSDSQGQFALYNVAPGTYAISVSYVGFSPFEQPVIVAAGQSSTVNPVLSVATESESIIVTAERAHGEAESINETRTSDNILNVLPAEVIRSLPNANVADALGRLPGVTLERDEGEGKYVQIRGTEPRLANLTIDGVEVPSPEGGVRQVKLDVIPSDLVESVQINKTLQADQNGDAIGGSVNLVTKKAGDRPTLSLYGDGGFTPIANTRAVYDFGGTAGQRFGAQKRFGVIVSGSYDYNGRGIDDLEPVPSTQQNPPYAYDISSAAIRQYLYDRKRYGFGGSADYKLSDSSNVYIHTLFSDFKDYGHRYEYILNTNDISSLPGSNVPGFTAEIRNPYFQVASLAVGGTHAGGTTLISWQLAAGRARMRNPIGGGESHTVFSYFPSGTDPVNNPPASNCQYDPAGTKNQFLPQFTPTCFSEAYDATSMKLSQIQRSDNGKTAQLNLEGTVSVAKNYHIASHASTFQAGFYLRNAHKFDDSYEIDYTANDPTAIPASLFVNGFRNSKYYGGHYAYGPGVSWEAVNKYLAANPNSFTASTSQGGNSNNFDLVERVTAGYLMNSLDFSRFHLVAGVRFEGTQDNPISCLCDPASGLGPLSSKGQGSYIDILPSASLRIRLDSQNNSALRLVYSRGLSRPDPQFLTTATSLDNSTTPPTLTIGNPALKPEHANNYDLLYERYLTPLGLIQAGFFYKDVSSPIVQNLAAPTATQPNQVNQAVNAGSAYITGVEFSFTQHFTYLPGFLSGLGLFANYSYATSQATNVNPTAGRTDHPALLRQAPNTWNISPTFDYRRLSARAGMSYNGPNIFSYFFVPTQANPDPNATPGSTISTPGGIKGPFGDVYLFSHFQVDAQASYYLGKGLTFVASGLNLNNAPFGFYQGSPQYFIQREYYKPTYTFGFRWEMGRER